jgi:hypothetical protein
MNEFATGSIEEVMLLRLSFGRIEWSRLIILKTYCRQTNYCFEVLLAFKQGVSNERSTKTFRRGGTSLEFSAGDLKEENAGMIMKYYEEAQQDKYRKCAVVRSAC